MQILLGGSRCEPPGRYKQGGRSDPPTEII